ncbi:hypothetical protein Y032_0296g1687 [Ancylostoma ceylanicum]|nr:hypothetical protein Y032_0296g1687 [Ancylostoma ceylanicum]
MSGRRSGYVILIFVLCQLLAVTVLLSWSMLFFMAKGLRDFERDFTADMKLLTDMTNRVWKNITNPELQSLISSQGSRTKRGSELTLLGSRWSTAAIEQNGCECCPGEMDKWGVNRRCPSGPQGPRGPKGADGEHGNPGQHGATGRHGDELVNYAAQAACILCPSGPPGLPGADGKVGPAGPPGASGRDGNPGPPGQPGPPGETVVKPIPVRGPIGPQGPIGFAGRPGMPGDTPRIAAPGGIGAVGQPGQQGARGAPGIAGPPGAPGAAGRDAEYCTCPKRSEGVEGKQRYSTGGEYYQWIRHYLSKRHL